MNRYKALNSLSYHIAYDTFSSYYKYLGSMIQEKKIAAVAEVQSRIGHAAAVFASLKWCLWKKADIATKMRLFPVPNHSDPTIWTGDLDPTGDGNQQTRDLSNAMPLVNLVRIPA